MADVEEIRVFIASPSDVEAERDALERVIKSVNLSVAGLEPVRLRLVRWETAVQPETGGDSQAIVSSQLAGEYEVFIGILWTHFGTPTPRSDSGTLEEFEAAVEKHKKDPSSVSVMFYFKDAPRAPMDIDPKQLQKVQEFRKKYKEDGIYGTFTDTDNFEKTLQIHLTRLAIGWLKGTRQVNATHLSNPVVTTVEAEDDSGEAPEVQTVPTKPPGEILAPGSDDDPGFLDLVEEGVQGFTEGAVVLGRLEKHMRGLEERVGRGTEDLIAAGDGDINPSKAKTIINALAGDIVRIAIDIQAEIGPFKNTYGRALRAYGGAANLLADFGGDTAEQLEDAISNTSVLEQSLDQAQKELLGLRNALKDTPRITSKYNKAKKKMLGVLGELEREISAARTSTKQTLQFFEELHGES